MKHARTIYRALQQVTATVVTVSLVMVTPLAAHAQEAVDASGDATGPTIVTGATGCTGAGCGQGYNQGIIQGAGQGLYNGVDATNSDTGADSDNQNDVDASSSTTNDIDNTSSTSTTADASANSGGNTSSLNSGGTAIDTGNAGIGVTQVINDNTTTIGGTAGLQVTGYNGDYNGDLDLGFGSGTANLSNTNGGGSVRATNDTTGYNSTNDTTVTTTTEQINEIQNDGVIDNLLELAAITGQNEASMNTGDSVITTGDANVAATLVNLLNTTVINGDLWVTVADIFGDINGNINIPDLAAWLSSYNAGLAVDATNENTGSDSTNTVNVGVTDTETTTVNNDADINTIVTANAITGQNDSLGNTGGAVVDTGDATVSASNVSLANTTIEGGNWGIFIVNALNGWLGFLVGDGGQVQALSQDETLQHIQAQNSNTGADSDNTVNVDHTNTTTDTVNNDADITNEIIASAITGQNETNYNTGAGAIGTGDANIQATTVNIANTTVKNGSLFVAVVNVFGDWFGDLLYGGASLAANAGSSGATGVSVDATNGTTGNDSTNEVNVDYDRNHTTRINNDADITTTLNANIDTGSNNANKNTGAARVTTGDGLLALHARSAANLTGIAEVGGLGISISGLNETTGESSENRIRANINDDRIIAINNEANISTVIGSTQNPATVNTGGNTANMNTLGAMIETGNASADIAIQNVVNQVIIALLGQGISVDANFVNELTGALSTNTGDLTVVQRTILDIINRGVIDNIINLILNTGANTADKNTGEVAISTGAGCVDITVDNDLNRTSGHKKAVSGAQDINATGINNTTGYDSTNTTNVDTQQTGNVDLTNSGDITNDADVSATTGNNQQNMNTGGGSTNNPNAGECPKIAVAVSPSPTPAVPSPTPSGGGEESEGKDDGDQGPDMGGVGGGEPRVAGVTSEKQPTIAPAKKGLMRFPVAGGEAFAQLMQGKKRLPWQLFTILSMVVLGAAWSFDRKSRAAHLGRLP